MAIYTTNGGLPINSENVFYSYVSSLPKLAEPQNLRWDGTTAKWDAVSNATSYSITSKSSIGTNRDTYTTTATSYDLGTEAKDGRWFTVVATADNYRDSNTAESPKYGNTTPQPGTITVTYDANGGTGTMTQETYTPDSSGIVKDYMVPQCGFTAPAGKEFDHWEDQNGAKQDAGDNVWLVMNMVYKAIWKDSTTPQPGTITVTYDANGGTGTMAQETYTPDSSGIVKDYMVPECRFTAPAGKEFDRWEDQNGAKQDAGDNVWLVMNMVYKAIWKDSTTPQPTTYTVTFNMGDHGTAPIDQEVIAGGNATKPTTDPTAEGWTFGGWYADATFSVEFDFNTAITANTTIYAKWTENSVTPPSPVAYTIIAGANGEWTKGSSAGLAFTSDAPFAKFDSVKVDGSAIAATNYTAEEGSTKITLAPAYLETLSVGTHSIEIVSNDGSASTNFTVKAAAQPSDPTTYKVTFDMGGHGTAPADQTVNEGSTATKPADPTAEGWTFGGWFADATFSVEFNFDATINANTTVYAKWTEVKTDNPTDPTDPTNPTGPAEYTVTFNMNGHGTQVAEQTVEDGSKATKPTDPTASGYTFGGWYADATFSAKFDFNTAITANTTVYAKWTKNSVAPTDPTSPQTGDNSHMFLWIALLFVSGGALVGTTVYGKKRKRAE